ncbi:nicotinate-nucleotide adenylyltransferase [Klebsiella sp. BIGb0407]|uniref:nicotinate-nucleotide adenylyltransferase n=1 Tax=Klebsiella sp. BIGb0407 TaxID=2940603 RepID=UPI0021679946|nr:nicotinate-nucleotide adenylyltransferase [Klebsiella sp. BIGb0407]MCS3432132.1 nicotinate-nucleotide adenylyltransferase [Klebsiella sp. BIGb0407]
MTETPAMLQAIYGGTFDPIHYGHLFPVTALAKEVSLHQVIIMPNNVPPHRPQPRASSIQRKQMVELAIADNPLFTLDCRELERSTPSWTVETLEQIRAEKGHNQPLAFIIGQDSLVSLPRWHRWEDLLSLCHLLVCQRPGYPLTMDTPELQQWLEQHCTDSVDDLHQQPAGKIFMAPTPMYDISATAIRQRLESGLDCDDLVPAAVLDFIRQQDLYR